MNNGTGEFVKHKFDLLLLVLVMAGAVGMICISEHWHDHELVIWATQVFSGLVAVFVNLITNRPTIRERVTDAPAKKGDS